MVAGLLGSCSIWSNRSLRWLDSDNQVQVGQVVRTFGLRTCIARGPTEAQIGYLGCELDFQSDWHNMSENELEEQIQKLQKQLEDQQQLYSSESTGP